MKKIFRNLMAAAIATLAFTACEDVPAPYELPNPGGGEETYTYTGSGTSESPYTCADAIHFVQSLDGAESDAPVYIKGKVASITEEFTTQYGNGTFTISDDGSTANVFTAYRVKYLGNQKFTSKDTQIQVGDEVIICGNVVNFKGNTPETVQNTGFLYSLNGTTAGGGGNEPEGEAKGTGTLTDPFNAAAAIAYAKSVGDNESDKDVYIKGKVASITEQYSTQYGNATFTISDDGSSTGAFTVYRALYLGNKKYTSGDLLNEKDDVIIYGKVTCFKGNTPETVSGKAYLYSLNGKTEAAGGGDTPQSGDVGSLDAPKTVAEALTAIDALAEGATTDANYYVKGKVVKVATAAEDIGPNSSSGKNYKDINYYISDDGTDNKTIYVYRGKNLKNTDFTSADQLKVDDEVIVYGKLQKYKNTKTNEIVPEIAQGNYLVKTSNTAGGGEQPGGGQGGGEVSGNTISVDFSSLGLDNQQKPSTLTLSDGTTLTFDGGGNTNAPAYYNTGTALRMYPKNTMAINAGSKKIAAIEIVCDEYNGTLYNASGDITVNDSKMTVDGTSLKYTGPNASTATVANTSSTTGAASQLRMKTLKITYAQ